MDIKVAVENQHLNIHIDGILHVKVAVPNIASIQSYKLSNDAWVVQLGLKEGETVEMSYVSQEMWKEVLLGLDKLRLY